MLDPNLLKLAEKAVAAKKDDPGAYRKDQAAQSVAADDQVKADSYIRRKHPVQYWLNPFTSGPITELSHRLARRVSAAKATSPTYSALSGAALFNPLSLVGLPAAAIAGGKDRQETARRIFERAGPGVAAQHDLDLDTFSVADDIRRNPELAKTLQDDNDPGAMQAAAAGRVRAADEIIGSAKHIHEKHPYQYWLNPLVSGPLTEMLARGDRRASATVASNPVLGYAGPAIGGIAGGVAGGPAGRLADLAVWSGEAAAGGPTRREVARDMHHKLGFLLGAAAAREV